VTRIVEIDGRNFRTLDEFFEVVGEKLVPGEQWGKNLDAFNDVLGWPLTRDREPYVLVWRRSNLSRKRLNHLEVERHWEAVVQAGGRKAGALQAKRIAEAARCEGPTAFDILVEIIQKHPDWLSLRLE
jgi:RNAse (barnase) inhibitor barstar